MRPTTCVWVASNRSGRGKADEVSRQPASTIRSRLPVRSTIPQPSAAVPGSIPRTITLPPETPGSPGDLGEELLGDLEVRGHALDVVQLLERFDEAEVLACPVPVQLDMLLRDHRVLGAVDGDPGLLERRPDALEIRRRGVDLGGRRIIQKKIVGARV